MALIVNHNLMALNAANNLSISYNRLSRSVSRLSSGLRITSSRDDAAGLAIRELMRSDIRVIQQGIRNANDAINMLMTADGAMSVIDEKLIRMKELAEQAATGTYTTAQRQIMNDEFSLMAEEITRIANATNFNQTKLLDGSLSVFHNGSGLKIHFGTGNNSAEDYYYITLDDVTAEGLGVGTGTTGVYGKVTTHGFTAAGASYVGTTTALDEAGYFAFYYNNDNDSTGAGVANGNEAEDVFAMFHVTSSMTLTDIQNQINQGTAARATLTLAGSQLVTGARLQIGGVKYAWVSAAGDAGGSAIEVAALGTTSATHSATALALRNAINDNGGDVYAVISGAGDSWVINLFARENGAVGNNKFHVSGTNVTATLSTAAGTMTDVSNSVGFLDGGGSAWITASLVTYVAPNGSTVYNLKLAGADANGSGDFYTVSIGNPGSAGLFSTFDQTTYFDQSGTSWDTLSTTSTGIDILTQSSAQAALAYIDSAIVTKDSARARAGSVANRIQNTVTNLTIQAENLQASEAAISDVDVASEMTEFTRNLILAQSGVAMLAQANSIANLALQLLGG